MQALSVTADTARPWPMIIGVLVLADVTATFETQMILAALKALNADLRDPVAVAWLVTSYLLISSVAAPILGRLGDLYGRKRMIVAAVTVAAAGSALSAAHPDPGWIIAGRALQGTAGAVLPLCYGIVREAIASRHHSFCGGLLIGATSVGAIAGLVIGGLIVDNYDWRYLFWLSALMGAAAAVLVLLVVPRSERAEETSGGVDIIGGLLFVPGAAALLFMISEFGRKGAAGGSGLAWGLAVIVLLTGWIWHELRHPNPLLDVRLLFRREMALTNLVMALVALGPFQLTLLMMLLLQSQVAGIGFGMTAAAAGAFKIPGNIGSTVSSPIAGHLCRKIGERWVMLFGLASNAAAWLAIFAGYRNFWAVTAIVVVSSIGTTVAYVGVNNQIARIAIKARVSESLGLNAALRSISHACGAQLMTIMLGAAAFSANSGSATEARDSFFRAFGFVVATCIAGMVAALCLPKAVEIIQKNDCAMDR